MVSADAIWSLLPNGPPRHGNGALMGTATAEYQLLYSVLDPLLYWALTRLHSIEMASRVWKTGRVKSKQQQHSVTCHLLHPNPFP